MTIDLSAVPFSTFGSFMCFNHLGAPGRDEALCLRTMHGVMSSREALDLTLVRGRESLPFKEICTPASLRLETKRGWAEIVFATPDTLRVRGRGVALRLRARPGSHPYGIPVSPGIFHVKSPATRTNYMLRALRGTLDVQHAWAPRPHERGTRFECPALAATFVPDGAGAFEGTIEEFRTAWRPAAVDEPFDAVRRRVAARWAAWLDSAPSVPKRYAAARELAAYINWSAVVNPGGMLTRPTMLMSKNWMTQCWSWDHCFNAMATASMDANLAWDQLMTLFDHQDAHGCLPDAVSAPMCVWDYCKPPVHGWALRRMMRHKAQRAPRRLREIYPLLSRWTHWWLRFRDYDGDGIPQYHHGNDSGWDNATVFDGGFAVESPDLAALLIVQMDVLADIAASLRKAREARQWKRRADVMLDRLMRHSWSGAQFVSPRNGTHEVFPDGDCLLNFIPVVLGARLPKDVRAKLAAALEPGGRFVTRFGPATESPHSPLYTSNGYWRGPIWAPSTMLIVDGLAHAGFRAQAAMIARRFCDMCARSGFAENFDALSGEPLCDRAYTWTSSVFLLLAHELTPA
ncbi:hypothetical protein GX586_09360 [bacterium]|nr:hypothetical protein [bacterium]